MKAALAAGPTLVFLASAFVAGGFYESTYSVLCAVVWFGLALAAALGRPPRPSPAVWALAALTALTLLSSLWGAPGEALRVAPLPALYTGVLYAAEWLAGSALLLGSLRAAIVLVAAAGVVGRATGLAAPAPEAGSARMAWPVTYANGLGLVCAVGVVLCVGLRPMWRLGALVCAAGLVWTFSRGAIVACVGALVLLAALRRSIPRRVLVAGAVCLLVLGAVLARPLAARFAAPAPDERDAHRLVDVSGHGRTVLWRTAWREGVAHPLAGGGAGTWPRFAIARTGRADLAANAHSLELETFAELGLLGLAALGVFLVAVTRARGEPAALAAFALWAVVSTTDWDWQLPAATVPALVAAGSLTGRRRRVGERAALVFAVAALAFGAAAAVHAVGATELERGKTTRLLPWDARPWARSDPGKACRIDPSAPVLTRAGIVCGRRR